MFRTSRIKKIFAVIALLVLLYNSGGYVFVYQQLILYTKNYIHTAIKNKKIDEEIVLLSFKKSDITENKINFKWKHEREFKYNGGMYDIVDRFETEDSIHFYCFYDHKENKIEENFNKHFENEKEEEKNNQQGRTSLAQLTDQYLIFEYTFNIAEAEFIYSLSDEWLFSLNDPHIPSPPPKPIIPC